MQELVAALAAQLLEQAGCGTFWADAPKEMLKHDPQRNSANMLQDMTISFKILFPYFQHDVATVLVVHR